MTDTSPDAEQVLIEVYRKMPIEQKWRQLGELFRCAKILVESGVRMQNPAASPREIHQAWLTRTFDPAVLRVIREAGHGRAP